MFKKDHYILGLIIGIFVPAILSGLILLVNYFLVLTGISKLYLDLQTHILMSIFGNLFPIRYYFVNLKFDKTGRGILIVTFVLTILFFIVNKHFGVS
ncbi:MAG: hypothetical protein K8R53_05490 [Bacteroidales bacterium]|nr:hypothetical protein [Bacteroidales bacterium]